MRERWKGFSENYFHGVVWIFGLVLFEVPVLEFLGAPASPDQAYYLHWLEFLCVGILTPLIVALIPLLRGVNAPRSELLRDSCVVYIGLWIVRFTLVGAHGSAIGLFGLESLILLAAGAFRGLGWRDITAALALSMIAWIVMMPQGVEFEPRPLLFSAPVSPAQIVFLIISGICAIALTRSRVSSAPRKIGLLYLTGVAIVGALLAFRVEDNIFRYNYGFFIGPAEIVRQGGWLLWDVPSQYGFLNVLLIALLPFKSTWESMRVLISILMVISTVIACWLFMIRRAGISNALFATIASIGFFEFEVGSNLDDSFFAYPSSGPLRFFWIYVIILILAQIYVSESMRVNRLWRRSGYAAWMFGCLWSAESAIYVSCAWLPAIALAEFLRSRSVGASVRASIVAILRCLGSATALALGVVGAMDIAYLVVLHHTPDWFEFVEFGLKYAGGLVRAPADPYGSIWLVIFELATIVASAVLCARARAYRALPLLLGAWGAVWATASYYLARSVNNNINALLSLAALVVAVVLLVGDRELRVPSARVLRLALTPILVWGLMLSLGNTGAFARMHLPFTSGYDPSEKATLQPASPGIREILAMANANSDTPIQYVDSWGVTAPIFLIDGRPVFEPRPWIPALSWDLFSELPPDRQQTYIERFEARRPSSGWLLSASVADIECKTYLPIAIDGRRLRSGTWQMLYCRAPVTSPPVVPRPFPISNADGTLYGSLDEFYFDGTPTFQTATFPIQVPIGKEFDVRGWLVDVDASPFRGSIIAAVDGEIAGKAVYGDSRPDVVPYMHKQHPGPYSSTSGFHIPILTSGLRAGPHTLQLYAVSQRGQRSALGRSVPFGAY